MKIKKRKMSDKILWFAVGSIFGGLIAFLVFIRISVAPMVAGVSPASPTVQSVEPTTKSYQITDFSGIRASGAWDIHLQRGDHYIIQIQAPEYLLEGLIVEKVGHDLRLSLQSGWRSKGAKLKASIPSPTMEKLRLSGSVNIYCSGFDSEALRIKASGSTCIKGDANKFSNLEIKGSGSFQMDLKNNPAIDVDLDLSGSSLVELTMAGGDLKGEISGSGKVIYNGEVNVQDVRISGSGRVERQ